MARAGLVGEARFGAWGPPISLISTYAVSGFGGKRGYDYSRSGNPTRDVFGAALAELEGGAGCVVTGTGMAAVTLVLLLARPGERVIAPQNGRRERCLSALALW